MATTRPGDGGKRPDWRSLDQATKFRVLANHFGTSDEFARASGIPAKTLKSIFAVIDAGKNSRVLERDEIKIALRAARHRMTDKIRRTNQAAQAAKFVAPVARTDFSIIAPYRQQLIYQDTGKVVHSYWVNYGVEYLPERDVIEAAKNLFEVFNDTGQFNTFRFEYLAEAGVYSGGRVFRDRMLRQASREMDFIKISTQSIPFVEFEMDSSAFGEYIEDLFSSLKSRGAIRITDLAFTHFDDVEAGMRKMRESIVKQKMKSKKGFKNGGGKKGRGYK